MLQNTNTFFPWVKPIFFVVTISFSIQNHEHTMINAQKEKLWSFNYQKTYFQSKWGVKYIINAQDNVKYTRI